MAEPMNLQEKAKELIERAKTKKTSRCPHCLTQEPARWTERSPGGQSKCSNCGTISCNWEWVQRSPTIDSETITALAQAYLDAVEALKKYDDMSIYFDCVKRENSSVIALEDSVRLPARDWLAKHTKGEG